MGKIGHRLIHLDEVDSTNHYAERMLRERDVEEGTVIRATFQTEGKGQGDNRWWSESGKNLTFSVILHPGFLDPGKQFALNKAISLGVHDFLSLYLDPVAIKWPNDILAGSKKIGGILIQHAVEGSLLKNTIVGIGLNINQTKFDEELSDATSLSRILRREFNLKDAMALLCDALEKRYSQLKEQKNDRLESDYCNALLGYREERIFVVESREVPGIIRGVDEFGRLLVEHPGTGLKVYAHKEIEFMM
ncbi:MAG: biotin--[acetyl-CoA-carboxylase] ligase [Bacteroidales bacterium]|nr:biotin--[acetyl-CoA-carboxylase] ligase [Bacteroidales bacterium]